MSTGAGPWARCLPLLLGGADMQQACAVHILGGDVGGCADGVCQQFAQRRVSIGRPAAHWTRGLGWGVGFFFLASVWLLHLLRVASTPVRQREQQLLAATYLSDMQATLPACSVLTWGTVSRVLPGWLVVDGRRCGFVARLSPPSFPPTWAWLVVPYKCSLLHTGLRVCAY